MTDQKVPRIGVVGLGNIGLHHTEQITTLDAQLVGGVDVNSDARTDYETTYDVPTYERLETLISEEEPDAIAVTTPNKFHQDASITALNHDVSVLCEKPPAHTLDGARKIARAHQQSDGFFMAGFNNRFDATTETVRDYRDAGQLGDITHIEANYIRRRGIPGRGSWFTQKAVAGGGCLVDVGVHILDLALYLLDFPDVEEVTGITRAEFGGREDYTYEDMWGEDQGPEHYDVEDRAVGLIRLADGKTITLNVSWAANRETRHDLVIEGTEAGVQYSFEGEEVTYYETDHEAESLETRTETVPDSVSHYREYEHFLDALRAGETPALNTMEQALTVQQVLDAVYTSSQEGQAIDFQDRYDTELLSRSGQPIPADD